MNFYCNMLESEADQEVFAQLYIKVKQPMYYLAKRLLMSEADAEDAVHDAFLKMADKFDKYNDQSIESLSKICSVVVKNAALDMLRVQKRRQSLEEEWVAEIKNDLVNYEDGLSALIEKYNQELLLKAFEQLDESEQDLLQLQYVIGMKPKEIGELLGVDSVIVRKKMLLIRKKLAAILKGDDYDDLRDGF
ncbi:MAG: sigma-70 family RNA polymerase sigma factor [Lachnospiraceae bacterium]